MAFSSLRRADVHDRTTSRPRRRLSAAWRSSPPSAMRAGAAVAVRLHGRAGAGRERARRRSDSSRQRHAVSRPRRLGSASRRDTAAPAIECHTSAVCAYTAIGGIPAACTAGKGRLRLRRFVGDATRRTRCGAPGRGHWLGAHNHAHEFQRAELG
jgi:hypothetical protein